MTPRATPGTGVAPAPAVVPAPGTGSGPEDHTLSDRARARILNGVAANTTTAYERQWTRFADWCAAHGRTALPATAETLTEYVVGLADDGKGTSTITQGISAIRTVHRLRGYPGAPESDAARLALRSHRRDRADAGHRTRQAPPITIDALRAMLDATDPNTVIGVRDRLVLVLGLAMMARRSELAALRLDDLAETADGLEVHIRRSKRDQDAHGATVAVPRGTHPDTDPVRLLAAWRAVLAEHGITDGALLRSVTRHGRIGQRLSDAAISNAVRGAAVRAGLPHADTYSAHSLRAGGATSAYRAGAPVSSIAAHGRWAPNSPVVLGYIRAVDRWKDNPMRSVGL